jgi:hypothetical protein
MTKSIPPSHGGMPREDDAAVPIRCTCHDEYVGGPHEGCSEFDPGPLPCPVHEGRIVDDGEGGWELVPGPLAIDPTMQQLRTHWFAFVSGDPLRFGDGFTPQGVLTGREEDQEPEPEFPVQVEDRTPAPTDPRWGGAGNRIPKVPPFHNKDVADAHDIAQRSRFVDHTVTWELGRGDAVFLLGEIRTAAYSFKPGTDENLRLLRLAEALGNLNPKESE